MTLIKAVGHRIAFTRRQKKMTQEDLAGEAEINRAFLSNIENGKANFTIEMLEKISKALKVRPQDLLE